MDASTARLVDFVMATHYAELPPGVLHAARARLIDTLACAFGGFDAPLAVQARAVAARQSGTPAARIWGTDTMSTPEGAAFANGVMLRVLDMNDAYRVRSGGHPSDVFAAVLALGDALQSNGAELIAALVAAYEVYCSFCDVVDANSLGWDQPVYGVVASALGAGKLLGLTRAQLGHAVALALAPNMALIQTRRGELSAWKGAAAANAARNGVFAALLALDGFTGPSAVIEGKGGLWDVLGEFRWDPAAGAGWRITRTHLKCFPLCYHGQAAVWAALDARAKLPQGRIAALHISAYAQAVEEMASDPTRWAPATRDTADHSLPYVVVTALRDGVVTEASFDDARLDDALTRDLMRRTTVENDAQLSARYPQSAPCRVRVTMESGEIIHGEIASAPGHHDQPLDDAAIEAKFHRLFAGFGTPAQADALLAALWSVDSAENISHLLAATVRQSTLPNAPPDALPKTLEKMQ